MSITRFTGITFGILVGLIISIVLFRYANTDKKIKTAYDERQQAIRNLAYKYAFYTVLIYEFVMLVFAISKVEIPLPDYAIHFFGIILGSTVLGVYSIWRDVYWGLNNNRSRYVVVFAAIVILNIIPVIAAIANGALISDGQIMTPVVNIIVLFMLFALLLAFVAKRLFAKEGDSSEDEA